MYKPPSYRDEEADGEQGVEELEHTGYGRGDDRQPGAENTAGDGGPGGATVKELPITRFGVDVPPVQVLGKATWPT